MSELHLTTEPVVTPNPGGQRGFAEDWKHEIVGLEGGWFSGKSFMGGNKLSSVHLFNAFNKLGEPTYVLSFVVAPTYGNAMDFCVPHLQSALTDSGLSHTFKAGGTIANGKYAGPAIVLPELGTKMNPSVILVRSADIPKRITGFTAGAAWGDEPARWKSDPLDPLNDPYIQMLGRVRDPKARIRQIYLTYTNEGDATKVYDEMHDGNPKKKLYRAPTRENPYAKDFEELQRDLLTEELAEQYLGGAAASLRGGRIYSSFDYDLHVQNEVSLRREIPLQLSVDFNIAPGMHMLLGQYHGDRDLFTELYEIHASRMDVMQACDKLFAILHDIGWKFRKDQPLEIYGDATGGSEWSGTGESNYSIIRLKMKTLDIPYRIRVPKANPLVSDRLNAVNCALKDVTGEIHMLIHTRCKRLIKDFQKMQRDKYGEIDKIDRKLSHASDAIGYKVWFIRPIRIMTKTIGGRIGVK